MNCRICSNREYNKIHLLWEMMFGFRDTFEYIECIRCGCIQIKTYPTDLSKYYPSEYYSYKTINDRSENGFVRWVRTQRAYYGLTGKGLIGKLLAFFKPLPTYYKTLRRATLQLDSTILEIGCGSGEFLLDLYREGFSNVTGIDPYIPAEKIRSEKKPFIFNADIFSFHPREQFDLIVMHHTLEHMTHQFSVVAKLQELVKQKGYLLISIPIVGYAWRKYGTYWAQLDPPRHMYIHSLQSFKMLFCENGFELINVEFNSTEFQFIASEQYALDIPMNDPRSFIIHPENGLFSNEMVAEFKMKATALNKDSDGDSATFLLRKKN